MPLPPVLRPTPPCTTPPSRPQNHRPSTGKEYLDTQLRRHRPDDFPAFSRVTHLTESPVAIGTTGDTHCFPIIFPAKPDPATAIITDCATIASYCSMIGRPFTRRDEYTDDRYRTGKDTRRNSYKPTRVLPQQACATRSLPQAPPRRRANRPPSRVTYDHLDPDGEQYTNARHVATPKHNVFKQWSKNPARPPLYPSPPTRSTHPKRCRENRNASLLPLSTPPQHLYLLSPRAKRWGKKTTLKFRALDKKATTTKNEPPESKQQNNSTSYSFCFLVVGEHPTVEDTGG